MNQKMIVIVTMIVVVSLGTGYLAGSSSSNKRSEAVITAEIAERDQKIEKLEKEIETLQERISQKKKSSDNMQEAFEAMKNYKYEGKGHTIDPTFIKKKK